MDPFPWLERWLTRLLGLGPDSRRRAPLRAVRSRWLAFHLLAVTLVAMPAPKPLTEQLLKRPSVAQEITRWHERLQGLGYGSDRATFEATVARVSDDWARKRKALLSPLSEYLRLIRVRQGWYMFTAPDRVPERYRVDAGPSPPKRGRKPPPPAGLERVFELGRAIDRPDLVPPGFLYHYRVRRALLLASWGQSKEHFPLLCGAFGRRIAERDDTVRAIRCRLLAQAVEHPARLGEKRRSRTVRELIRRVRR